MNKKGEITQYEELCKRLRCRRCDVTRSLKGRGCFSPRSEMLDFPKQNRDKIKQGALSMRDHERKKDKAVLTLLLAYQTPLLLFDSLCQHMPTPFPFRNSFL